MGGTSPGPGPADPSEDNVSKLRQCAKAKCAVKPEHHIHVPTVLEDVLPENPAQQMEVTRDQAEQRWPSDRTSVIEPRQVSKIPEQQQQPT